MLFGGSSTSSNSQIHLLRLWTIWPGCFNRLNGNMAQSAQRRPCDFVLEVDCGRIGSSVRSVMSPMYRVGNLRMPTVRPRSRWCERTPPCGVWCPDTLVSFFGNTTRLGGYTLEAELGIRPNGFSDPDFHGWEIKQHAVTKLSNPEDWRTHNADDSRADGGIHVIKGSRNSSDAMVIPTRRLPIAETSEASTTRSRYALRPASPWRRRLDAAKKKITDFSKGISLIGTKREEAATWHYKDLLSHWTREHALAAYVPSISRKDPVNQYQYAELFGLQKARNSRCSSTALQRGRLLRSRHQDRRCFIGASCGQEAE